MLCDTTMQGKLSAMMRAEQDGDDVLVWIKAVPGASRNEIAGTIGDRLKVRVSVPAQAGRANEAVCAVVARALGVKAKGVILESGHANPQKIVRVRGATLDDVKAAMAIQR